MIGRPLTDAQISSALRAHLPDRAYPGLRERILDATETTRQQRALPSFLGGLSDADPVARRRSLLIAAALLVALAFASAAAVGALRLMQRDPIHQLSLEPPADLPAFVRSTYDRMPQMPPVAITTLEDGSIKGRIYVDRSGAVRIEHYATAYATEPDTYEILNGTTMGQLAIVGSTREWVQQEGAISEDPRVFLLAAMEGGAAYGQPGCEVTRNEGEVGNGTAASGWTYVGVEYVAGRPAHHVECGGGDLWIDVETRLTLRSRGPARNESFQPVPGSFRTIEVTALEFGEQPANLFEIAQPAGVASVSIQAYACQVVPAACTPEPAPPAYTPPPGAVVGPLPSVGPSRASNGWIAYSTDGQNPGGNDITTGSDIYLVREGGESMLVAGREGGTTRNVCPAFSPDGTRLAFGAASDQGRAIVILGVDANGVTGDATHIAVPGPGPAVCVRWSADGTRVGYLDGGSVVIRGLDGSSPGAAAGDPTATQLQRSRNSNDPLLSPSGEWVVRISPSGADGCEMVLAKPDGSEAHVMPLSYCPYSVATWSPDGRQVLLMQDVSGFDFTMHSIAVDSPLAVTIVSTVRTNGSRSWPGWGDVSWQPVFP